MKAIVSELFSLLSQYGVRYAVCSPGSRNAELLQQASVSEEIKKIIIVDERTAAFSALGIGLITRKPVALICTSGSAVLNYSPAVAEAYYQGVPLIIISADRPYEWIDQDDSQTIRQNGALNNLVKTSYDIDAERSDSVYKWYVNRIINEGLLTALEKKEGPVHFNIHLSGNVEPVDEGLITVARKVEVITPSQRLSRDTINVLAEIARTKKIMLVAGFMSPDNRLQKAVLALEKLPNVCIMAETVSNLHLPQQCYMVDTVLFPLDSATRDRIKPDIVITLGGALISRKLKEFLREAKPKYHWSFTFANNLVDCFMSLTQKMECDPAPFLAAIAKRLSRLDAQNEEYNNYRNQWYELRANTRQNIDSLKWCDLTALNIVLNSLPKDSNLFLSNGTSVRYGQIIPYKITHATFSNRGVSGIEGSTSTAIGASLVYNKLTCLVTGDMSFAYDIGALRTELASGRLKIIVLNNGGGEIFRFIKATKELEIREKYLCVCQESRISLLAKTFGWAYYYANSKKELKKIIREFFRLSEIPMILHIDTRGINNSEILTNFLNKYGLEKN